MCPSESSAATSPSQQAFKDCLRLRELAQRQTLTRKDNADLERIADRLHALAVMHERSHDLVRFMLRGPHE
jgi:hypothetical protein